MRYAWWDRLSITGGQRNTDRRLGRHCESQGSLLDLEASQGSLPDDVALTQRQREALGIEGTRCPHASETSGQLGSITERAVELRTGVLRPS
jgi:hypothetical protein